MPPLPGFAEFLYWDLSLPYACGYALRVAFKGNEWPQYPARSGLFSKVWGYITLERKNLCKQCQLIPTLKLLI
jgi:hypothetical protein